MIIYKVNNCLLANIVTKNTKGRKCILVKLFRNFGNVMLVLFALFLVMGCDQENKPNNLEKVFNELFDEVDLTKVVNDLDFPNSINGVEIEYDSGKPEIISNEGKVNRQEVDTEVEVIIVLKQDKNELIKKVKIIVLKNDQFDFNTIFNKVFKDVDLNNVTSDLIFPSTIDSFNITYSSSLVNVLSNTGKVVRQNVDIEIDLLVLINNGMLSSSKTFKIIIIKSPTDILQETANSIFDGKTIFTTQSDLEFNTLINGINITYESSDTSTLANNGKVTLKDKDINVILKVTLSDGLRSIFRSIDVTVLHDPIIKLERVFNNLFIDIDLNNVVNNINLLTSVDGVNIQYLSSNTNVLSNTGEVIRNTSDENITLTVKLALEGKSIERVVSIKVLKWFLENYPINKAIEASIGTSVTVQGIVTGVVGDSAYIHDGIYGIYIYKLGTNFIVGDSVKLTGIKDVFNGLIQLKTPTNIEKLSAGNTIPNATTITKFSEINKQSNLYNISGLKVVNYTAFTSNTNILITVKDETNQTLDIIISKYVDSQIVFEIANKLDPLNEGDTINLTNIIIGYYNKYQFQLTSTNQIEHIPFTPEVVETNPIDPYYPDPKNMTFLQYELDKYITSGLTPTGSTNVLVIPVAFTDYGISQNDLDRLNKAMFGTSVDTGWESVKSYYEKSSYSKFSFNGKVLDTFQTGKPSTYYANKYNNGADADYEIIKAALQYYDGLINYANYDNNHDGYIDGIYFIYATEIYYGEETGSTNDSDLWWAYVYQYYTEEVELYDGVEANYYLWAGIDFMDEALVYSDYDDTYININASTYIHETGHMLGLDDYYDYEEGKGPEGGLGGADMMDYTVGDHNPFSKLMLNWVTPLVVSGKSTTVKLKPFESSGETIIVSTNWNNTYFDEYFMIDFYSPTGLNEAHSGSNGLYDIPGIRIIHVDAKIASDQSETFSVYVNNNSNTNRKLLTPIEADFDNSIENQRIAENDDLFKAGDTFGMVNNYRLSNGGYINFNIEILSIGAVEATIKITFN